MHILSLMENCLINDFEHQVREHPNKLAIVYNVHSVSLEHSKQCLTYEQLNINIHLIQKFLKQFVNKHQCVGIVATHHTFLPAFIFGVLKLQAAFILVDAVQINERTLKILQYLQIPWLLHFATDNTVNQSDFLVKNCNLHSSIQLLHLAGSAQLWKTKFSMSDTDFADICYAICTSGTTGAPKFVRVTHSCIYWNIACLKSTLNITTKDVIFLNTPVTFDPIFIEIFLSLCGGAILKIVCPQIRLNPTLLLKHLFLENVESVTVLQIPPSLFFRWSEKDIRETILSKTSSLRILITGGEHFNANVLALNQSEAIEIYSIYGITEVSCWASIYKFRQNYSDISEIPLGIPLDSTILEVRNDKGDIVNNGEGELFIGSNTRICLIDDEKVSDLTTGPVFRATGDVVRITDDQLFYLHRKNEVFKRFGTKISLTQIENRIRNATQLRCSCIYSEDVCKLILFVAIKESNEDAAKRIKDKLSVKLLNVLEKNCVPDYIELLPHMPLTSHGKVDKTCLKHLFFNNFNRDLLKQQISSVSPAALFKILCSKYLGFSENELLKRMNCTFNDLGGNSITILQLITEFKESFSCERIENCLHRFIGEVSFEQCLTECENAEFTCVVNKKRASDDFLEDGRKTRLKFDNDAENLQVKIRWSYDMDSCVDASPCIFKIGSNSPSCVAIGSFSHKFALVSAETGAKIATRTFTDAIESSAVASHCGKYLFVGCYDGFVYSMDSKDLRVTWKHKTDSRIKSTPCLCKNGIAVGSYDEFVYCLDYKTGHLIWKTKVNGCVSADPKRCAALESVFVATLKGTFLSVSEVDGTVNWKRECNVPVFGAPAFLDECSAIVWANVKGTLNCFDTKSGNEMWSFTASGHIYSSLIERDGKICFCCQDKHFYCLEPDSQKRTCNLAYKTNLGDAVSSTPCVFTSSRTKSVVVASATNCGKIYFMDFAKGHLLNVLDLENETFSSPIYADSGLYVGCRDNRLYCIDVT